MRNLPLFTLLGAALAGCVPSPNTTQVASENWVDEQIAQSATSISLAQQRLHQTNAVQPVPTPAAAVVIPTKVLPPISVSPPVVATSPPAVVSATKSVPSGVAGQLGMSTQVPVSVAAAGPTQATPLKPIAVMTAPAAASAVPTGKALSLNAGYVPGAKNGNEMKASTPAPVVVPVKPAPKPLQAWVVSPKDKTIRETLAKWSGTAGYTFNPIGRQHWTVAEDFDVVASDTMYGDFRTVVRRLIASTELTKTPLQPCFYSNRVVRVILINEECNTQTSQVRSQ